MTRQEAAALEISTEWPEAVGFSGGNLSHLAIADEVLADTAQPEDLVNEVLTADEVRAWLTDPLHRVHAEKAISLLGLQQLDIVVSQAGFYGQAERLPEITARLQKSNQSVSRQSVLSQSRAAHNRLAETMPAIATGAYDFAAHEKVRRNRRSILGLMALLGAPTPAHVPLADMRRKARDIVLNAKSIYEDERNLVATAYSLLDPEAGEGLKLVTSIAVKSWSAGEYEAISRSVKFIGRELRGIPVKRYKLKNRPDPVSTVDEQLVAPEVNPDSSDEIIKAAAVDPTMAVAAEHGPGLSPPAADTVLKAQYGMQAEKILQPVVDARIRTSKAAAAQAAPVRQDKKVSTPYTDRAREILERVDYRALVSRDAIPESVTLYTREKQRASAVKAVTELMDDVHRQGAQQPPWLLGRQALCYQLDPGQAEVFYPSFEKDPTVELARKICYACPLLADCVSYVVMHPEADSVRGSLTPEEVRRIRAKRGISNSKPKPDEGYVTG